MGATVYPAQMGGRYVRVHLSGSQGGMAEKLLNGPQVGATFEEMGGKGVAQRVGGYLERGPEPFKAPMEPAANVRRCQLVAVLGQEHRLIPPRGLSLSRVLMALRVTPQSRPPLFQIPREGVPGHISNRDHALLPALTAVSYTHLRAHETRHDLVCRLL